jgi:hypothetical protein
MQSNEAIRNIKAQELILHAQEAPHIQKWHLACRGVLLKNVAVNLYI